MSSSQKTVKTIEWVGGIDGKMLLIDQTKLPGECTFIDCTDTKIVFDAIVRLSVRGAPAIGVSAAYGVIIGLQNSIEADADTFDAELKKVTDYLATSRPTAVNLFWALDRMKQVASKIKTKNSRERLEILLQEAHEN